MAFVLFDIFSKIFFSSICQESIFESTKIGFAPTYFIEFTVATYVNVGTITSSPFFISRDNKAKCKAAVPLTHEIAYFNLTNSLNFLSNFSIYMPLDDIQFVFRQSLTYFFS